MCCVVPLAGKNITSGYSNPMSHYNKIKPKAGTNLGKAQLKLGLSFNPILHLNDEQEILLARFDDNIEAKTINYLPPAQIIQAFTSNHPLVIPVPLHCPETYVPVS